MEKKKRKRMSMMDLEVIADEVGIAGRKCIRWESRETFVDRILLAIDGLSKDRWERLRSKTQIFFNKMIEKF